LGALGHSISSLASLKLIENATFSVRCHGAAPLFKAYILNGDEVFFGLYPVERHLVTIGRQDVDMWDLTGKEVDLLYQSKGEPDSVGRQYVDQFQRWFDSMWDSVSRDLEL
jgi:hypothetical protein